jgi:hypothetical protein
MLLIFKNSTQKPHLLMGRFPEISAKLNPPQSGTFVETKSAINIKILPLL